MAGMSDDAVGSPEEEDEEINANATITPERYAEMSAAENLILTITASGSGKLSSSHDYPVRGRGGMGVSAIDKKNARRSFGRQFSSRNRGPNYARYIKWTINPCASRRDFVSLSFCRGSKSIQYGRRGTSRVGRLDCRKREKMLTKTN